MGPQPTKMEQMSYELVQHCEMKSMSLARQIRTICIVLGIKEADFVKAFEDDSAHTQYIKNTVLEQQKSLEERKKHAEKVQAEKEKLQPVQAIQDEQAKKV